MKIIINAFAVSEAEQADARCDYAVVTLSQNQVEQMQRRLEWVQRAKKEDPDLECVMFDSGPVQWLASSNGLSDRLDARMSQVLEDHGWFVADDGFTVADDESVFVGCDQVVVWGTHLYWRTLIDNTNVYLETALVQDRLTKAQTCLAEGEGNAAKTD